jgi:hypothetical protein
MSKGAITVLTLASGKVRTHLCLLQIWLLCQFFLSVCIVAITFMLAITFAIILAEFSLDEANFKSTTRLLT